MHAAAAAARRGFWLANFVIVSAVIVGAITVTRLCASAKRRNRGAGVVQFTPGAFP
jgi:hypothetical protein